MTLPYENATSGKNAIGEMQKILQTFGASSFGTMQDFAAGKVLVHFEHRERRVSIEASFKGYAVAWLRHHPYGPRTRGTRQEHEKRAMARGEIAVWSILRDWIKGQVTAVEVGMMSFEAAFLGQILLSTGETILDRITHDKLLSLTDNRNGAR